MSDLTHLFRVGQIVVVNTDGDETPPNHKPNYERGTVREVYKDHIIVDVPSISDHMWYENGLNISWVYPEYNFNF